MDFSNLAVNDIIYLVLSAVLICLVMGGIYLMSKVKLSRVGNGLSAVAMLAGIILVLVYNGVFDFAGNSRPQALLCIWIIVAGLTVGAVIGWTLSKKVKMIQMPQMVALLNGLGGAASAFVGIISCAMAGKSNAFGTDAFTLITAALAVSVGMITLMGSLVAAGKLHRVLPQKPIVFKGHQVMTMCLLCLTLAVVVLFGVLVPVGVMDVRYLWILLVVNVVVSALFGVLFSIRVGGADMPITISLLNSLSGVAGAIAGLALHDILLVAVGGIVGASGLILTQIMCKAINRKLLDILIGKTAKSKDAAATPAPETAPNGKETEPEPTQETEPEIAVEIADDYKALREAKDVIIVPGYGMAIAQAQHLVKKLADTLVAKGAKVRYAIHPVAGRMPGHMNVLLCEADVDYEDLYEMSDIDGDFKTADCTIVVGANDVLNPAANTAKGTPIYGMPVLSVADCKEIYIFNYDTKPGYAGVDNPLYERSEGVHIFLGNAADTLGVAIDGILNPPTTATQSQQPVAEATPTDEYKALREAKDVIIVPGYGMAIAQAQHLVKKLADTLVAKGAKVRYAIHPVAGRMPGHMNVLLCEADVDYEDLYEMSDIDGDFKTADCTIVVGANDVLNPAANTAKGTPIYGMPVLSVADCKEIYIFNYDTKPGYAGVDNPLYERSEGVHIFLGNAADTLSAAISELNG